MATQLPRRKSVLVALTAAASLLLSVAGANADEKYTIRPAAVPGVSAKFTSAADTNMTLSAAGQQSNVAMKVQRDGTITVKEVAKGSPTAIEITYGPNCTMTQTANGQPQEQKFPLAGKTVRIQRGDNGKITHNAGDVDPAVEAEITKMIDVDTAFYPEKPVAVGDEWVVDPAKLQAVLPQGLGAKAELKCRLAKLGTVHNRPTYDVVITGSVAAEQNGGKVNVQIGGVMQIDQKLGVPIQQDVVMKMTGGDGNQQVAMNMQMAGSFVITGGGEVAVEQVVPNPVPMPNPLRPVEEASFAGQFKGDKVSADFAVTGTQVSGFILMGEKRFPATAKVDGAKATGQFEADGAKFDFTASLTGNTLTIESGGVRHTATRAQAARPEPKPKNPLE